MYKANEKTSLISCLGPFLTVLKVTFSQVLCNFMHILVHILK